MNLRALLFHVTLWPALVIAATPPKPSRIELRFDEIRNRPPELYAFLFAMPKGGDLHNHFSGAVYAESYLRVAAEDGLCVNLRTFAIIGSNHGCGTDGIEAARAASDNTLAAKVIDSLSMRDFVPGHESSHDHFFAAFTKFGPYKSVHRGELLAEVIRRAAAQNESYLELMTINGASANAAGSAAGFDGNFDATRNKLIAADLAKAVETMRASVEQLDRSRIAALGCDAKPETPPCRVQVRYIYQVLRESPPAQAFAQVLAGFMLASTEPLVAGVNFVQPEDGIVSMRDYRLQMQMVDYAKRLYPKVHISLHAGELAPGLVPPEGLRFHIRDAVELGHAERIGHGVDIMYETGATALLKEMKQRGILVEINLTSNDLILGVRGADHPFPVYRKYGVPVALSTDDEGVSRSHLTEEFMKAVETYRLSYADLKRMVRNSLEYSFLPGASYWRDRSYRSPVGACAAAPRSKSCATFLGSSEKARIEADIEDRFRKFEKQQP